MNVCVCVCLTQMFIVISWLLPLPLPLPLTLAMVLCCCCCFPIDLLFYGFNFTIVSTLSHCLFLSHCIRSLCLCLYLTKTVGSVYIDLWFGISGHFLLYVHFNYSTKYLNLFFQHCLFKNEIKFLLLFV